MAKTRREQRIRRKKHIRKKVSGNKEIPRVCVFKSNKYFYAQMIDDTDGKILAATTDKKLSAKKDEKPVDRMKRLGQEFGKIIVKAGVKKIVFDRSGYMYHGRIKSFADGIRESGVKF